MDTIRIRIILPDDRLATEVEGRLAAVARTEREPASSMDFGIISILVTIGASLATIALTRAQIEATRAQADLTRTQAEAIKMDALKTLLEIRQLLQERGQADMTRIGAAYGPPRTFAEADESFLRELLGMGEA